MARLRTSELEALLAFVAEATAIGGAAPFRSELLDRLATLVPSTAVSFEEVDFSRRVLVSKVCSTGAPAVYLETDRPQAVDEGHWLNMNASPTAAHRRRSDDFGMLKWSDFIPHRQRAAFAAGFEQHAVIDQASIWLTPSHVHKVSVVFESDRGDFSERDRLVANLLRPHLAALYRNANVRRILAAALAALERGADADGRGVVLRGRDGAVEFVSSAARRLLAAYFDDRGGGLPPALDDWIRSEEKRPHRSWATPSSPYTVARPPRRLVVHADRDLSMLLLTEEPALAVPLTARERDVMRCIAAGNSNAETARLLWITPGTVRKHLENVYEKLAVRSRTAALARLGYTTRSSSASTTASNGGSLPDSPPRQGRQDRPWRVRHR
jgi:DNA-binding CsgD family transcriptional regulator